MNAVLLFVFLAPNAAPQDTEEFKRLAGTWEVVREEQDGMAVDRDGSVLPPKVRFTDVKPEGIEKRCDIYTFTLDPKADPRRLTASVAGGEIKGDRMLVTYRLDKDTLTLRMKYGGKEFPEGFKTTKLDGTIVLELRRAKQ